MAVKNHLALVQQAHAEFGPLDSHERCGAFTEFVIAKIHKVDPDIGHLRKDPGRTNYHGHALDAALSKSTGRGIDLIGAAKIASKDKPAMPTWGVEDVVHYSAADWIDPDELTTPQPHPQPTPQPPTPSPAPPVCPPAQPTHSYADTLSLANELDAAYRAETGRTVHPEPLAHWIWRYQFEGYTRDALIAEALERGRREA